MELDTCIIGGCDHVGLLLGICLVGNGKLLTPLNIAPDTTIDKVNYGVDSNRIYA